MPVLQRTTALRLCCPARGISRKTYLALRLRRLAGAAPGKALKTCALPPKSRVACATAFSNTGTERRAKAASRRELGPEIVTAPTKA